MIRLALIGCGQRAAEYVQAAAHIEDVTVTAAVDRDPEKAGRTAQASSASIAAAALDELLAEHSSAFDAVLINSDNVWHEADCKRAAAAGKHVLVETPLALTTEQASAVIDACQRAGVQLMVGQSQRFLPSIQTVKQAVDSGKLGEPGLLRVHCWQSPGLADWQQLRQEAARCGGTLLHQLSAKIDLANWLFQGLPTAIYAAARCQSNPHLQVYDYVQIHLGFPGGAMALLDYSMTLPRGADYFSLSMIGSTGAAYADDHHNMQLLYRGGDPSALKTGQGQAHIRCQLSEFVRAVSEQREPAISGAEGRAAVLVAEAAAESIANARAMRLSGGRYELA